MLGDTVENRQMNSAWADHTRWVLVDSRWARQNGRVKLLYQVASDIENHQTTDCENVRDDEPTLAARKDRATSILDLPWPPIPLVLADTLAVDSSRWPAMTVCYDQIVFVPILESPRLG